MPKKPAKLSDSVSLESPDVAPEAPPAVVSGRPKREMKAEQFWPFVAGYDAEACTDLYVYRVWPRILKKPAYIAKLADRSKMNEAWLLRTWGSGTYELSFNDKNLPFSRVCRCVLTLDASDFPPIITPGTLDMGHQENQSFIANMQGRGLLAPEGDNDMGSEAAGVAIKSVVDLSREVLNRNQQKPADDGGAKSLEVISKIYNDARAGADPLALAKQLKDLMAPAAPPVDILAVVKLVREMSAPPAAAVDPLAAYARIDEIVQRAVSRSGSGGGGSDSPWWAPLAAAVAPLLPALLARLSAPVPAAPAPGYAPAPGPHPAPAPVLPFPAAPAVESEFSQEVVSMFGMLGIPPAKISRLLAVAKEALAAYKRGVSGADFAHGLCTMFEDGDETYGALVGMGKEQLTQLAAMLAGNTVERPALDAWVADFCAYDEPEPAAGAEGDNASTV